jgi:hypothetical protein
VVGCRYCTCLLCILAAVNVIFIWWLTATGFACFRVGLRNAGTACSPANLLSGPAVVGSLFCACSLCIYSITVAGSAGSRVGLPDAVSNCSPVDKAASGRLIMCGPAALKFENCMLRYCIFTWVISVFDTVSGIAQQHACLAVDVVAVALLHR